MVSGLGHRARRLLAGIRAGLLALACAALSAGPVAAAGNVRQPAVAPVQTAAMPAVPSTAAVLDARLGAHPDKTRFVLDLTRDTDFRVEVQRDPWRVRLDLPDLAWSVPSLPAGKGLVSAIIKDPTAKGRLRLLLATTGPVRVASAEVIPPRDGRPPRFILDLAPGDGSLEGKPLGTLAALTVPLAPPVPEVRDQAVPATPKAIAAAGLAAPVPVPPRKPAERQKPMIVIDAGHGGQDPGAIAVNGKREKDITLAMARELRQQLLATKRYRVTLTRDGDSFIPLRDRVGIAREQGADLFISLHADSIGRSEVRGLSVYTLSDKASDREAEMLAQRENRSDAIVGLDLSDQPKQVVNILIGLAQRDTMNESRRFANLLVDRMDPQVTVLPSPLRSAGFAVLTAPDVPSVLVEMGYLSHPKDARLLTSSAHQRRLAASLARAVDGYFGRGVSSGRS
ncbi:N-acetylmuramoyl-L-alanine amidase [Aerophototrophica crusticola]|uniref:N-acetylmuramoyl-L-alanine amidase n=1 Tax=Aerophototrophica crusticola TaxID=1709002 RepID=A0A858R5A8_9PROT|nr:N-acetylmuramoyl-L-alanine amidase [Rhodospirillaceae bacterium B3]